MPNGMNNERMHEKLTVINEIVFSKHAVMDAIPSRHLDQNQIEGILRAGEDIVSIESQEDDVYRIHFVINKRRYFSITVKFLTTQKLKVITVHYVSVKRFKRYQKWLQKKRR